ncbi:MAG: V-type ATP synthase subunit F [Candidatus Marsarchaeota archaeon]|nr:V-type ATP synthase subunit F [Candidatus Marsarchaeota archaeon]
MAGDGENYNYKIAIMGEDILCAGFRLLGDKKTYHGGADAEATLKELIGDPEIGIIVVNQKIIKNIKNARTIDLINKTVRPLIIEVPGYNEEDMHQDTLRKIILKAIGMDIKV